MTVRYFSRNDVEAACAAIDLKGAIADILVQSATGQAGQAVRTELVPGSMPGVLGMMPSYRAGGAARFAAKVVCVMPGNPARGLPAHQGIAMIFDGREGHLLGMADAAAVTEFRTAAMAALATQTLARPDARRSLVVGAGHQALPHLVALHSLDRFDSSLIWARRPEAALAVRQAALEIGIKVDIATDLEAAVSRAEVVTTVTGASEPVIRAEWLKPGAHVNAMGSSTPRVREFGPDLLGISRLFVDDIDSALSLAGELVRLPARPEATGLGAVLAGQQAGRERPEQVTLFKSVGIALQDLALMDRLIATADSNLGQALVL